MTRRTKAMLIIGAVWLALMTATVVAFIAGRGTTGGQLMFGKCLRQAPDNGLPGGRDCLEYGPNYTTPEHRIFDSGGFWAWSFAITLAALVAVIIVHVVTRPRSAS